MARKSSSQIYDEAAGWVARIDAGNWQEVDEAELQLWLEEDSRHRGALLRTEAAWITLDTSSMAGQGATVHSRFNRRAIIAGGGAALAASLAGGALWYRTLTDYTTAVGEIRRVPLDDGSMAAINTDSKVAVNFIEQRREIRLDRGEAWFQVAKDAERPFIVEAGRIRAQAVGTAFSVRRRDNGADILVTEGVVEAWADGAEGNRIRLAAGEQAFVADNAALKRQDEGPSSVDQKLAWRAGKIELVGESLAEAAEEFNRYNRRKLVLVDPALAHERFDGIFRTDDPAGFASAVQAALDVPVDTSQPTEIRLGAAKP